MMNKWLKMKLIAICSMMLFAAGCDVVPITGRKQLNIVPDSTINAMSFKSYNEVIAKSKLSTDAGQTAMVKRVGRRIQQAVEEYCAKNNLSDQIKGYNWEFNLIEDKQVNAWCMPGGKVAVYTGILLYTQNEDGLAVVMGHEIAHAIAKHGSERMSQGLLVEMGGIGLSAALANKPGQTQNLFMKSYGAGTEVGVLLPFSRKQETEADRMGLIFMAMAGYDPRGAVEFWQRMSQQQQEGKPIELLSTHPSDQTRINNIKKFLPEAMSYYN
jgi:predicted Zn-dependent protease